MNIKSIITQAIQQSLLLHNIKTNINISVQISPKHYSWDYQCSNIIQISTIEKINPYTFAKKIVSTINLHYMCSKIEASTKGFINFFISNQWIENTFKEILYSPKIGVNTQKQQTIVVDYSSPNIAKEMHVGHLRSTIIGDSIVKHLEFLGHRVIRANHIGDWGTQFGMLIAFFEETYKKNPNDFKLTDFNNFYQKAKKKFSIDLNFANKSRKYVLKLQTGNKHCTTIWKKIVNITIKKNQKIYEALKVSLKTQHIIGESFYHNMLAVIVKDLLEKKIAVVINKSVIVFLNQFKNRQGAPMGVVIQKSDGAYLYSTIDIACLKYRYQQLHADRILYYTDSRQKQHLEQVIIIAKKAGYIPLDFKLEHHIFGMVLSKNKRPFKTRDGKTIRLNLLIHESKKRAKKIILEKNPKITKNELKKLSEIIGIGAMKYADLSKNRVTNYIFDWDSMLKFEGNTAPYIQYAYVRIISIFKKIKKISLSSKLTFTITNDYERKLAIKILQFEEIIIQVIKDGTPHIMCTYLYELSVLFSKLYTSYSILSSKDDKALQSKLKLLFLISKILKKGLLMLGIKVINQM
ncbi:arginine--tRNA ligase [Buchnera aphidicola (Nipponaphis monzeni)]|uniref:Arginine--tRNA ligase n=1 Tax=Buchnera aphidicola (Nipponaphis monzeni) TaxID=2495405 RepID=A0A455TA32_9GAMM|nr:arginine--tRNA ligase [Buchnera aphidicola]BBI01206.1 arginine--tRNA ligase [Buchnera aphidicola (Nipponaphis monzeni)]